MLILFYTLLDGFNWCAIFPNFSCNSMFPIFPIWARQLFQYWLAHISIMVSRKPHTTGKPILELWASQYFQYSFTKTTHQNHTHNGNMGEPIMEIWASQNFQYGFTKTTQNHTPQPILEIWASPYFQSWWANISKVGEPIFPIWGLKLLSAHIH